MILYMRANKDGLLLSSRPYPAPAADIDKAIAYLKSCGFWCKPANPTSAYNRLFGWELWKVQRPQKRPGHDTKWITLYLRTVPLVAAYYEFSQWRKVEEQARLTALDLIATRNRRRLLAKEAQP